MSFYQKSFLSLSLMSCLLACGAQQPSGNSQIKVTDVQHSEVKRQSIGNCWLYATASWVESLHLAASQNEINVSESYWTYWHWYEQIVNSKIEELNTSGSWNTASNIILQHGYVAEGVFIPEEADVEMSLRQDEAMIEINEALAPEGSLNATVERSPEAVMALLDRAFGVDMRRIQEQAQPADRLLVQDGILKDLYLKDLIDPESRKRWQVLPYPRVQGLGNVATPKEQKARRQVLKRVMNALNDRHPVIMSFMVEFNALNPDNGRFEHEFFTNSMDSVPGQQGGHLLVLEDYTVTDVPGLGELGEGDVNPVYKLLAVQGRVQTLVAKNSWGINRPERGLTNGYTRFSMDYLDTPYQWIEVKGEYSPLGEFILPPGY